MRTFAIGAAALAVGLILGCNKPPETPPMPPPEPQPKPSVKAWKADEELGGTTSVRTPTPPVPPSPPVSPPANGTRKYVVKAKDTMIGIARAELGNEHRLKDIKALNPGVDADHLTVGQEIVLPAK